MQELDPDKRDTEVSLYEVLAGFPLPEPRVISSFDSSTRNDLWLVEDAKSLRYVLTRHRQHQTQPGRVEFQLRFQEHLRIKDFPTARAITSREGRLLLVDGNGMPWSLSSYVTGTHYDFQRMSQVKEAAKRLAQFHSAAESFPEEEYRLDHYRPIRDRWESAYENQSALKELFSGVGVERELTSIRERDLWVLSAWPLARFDALPVGWTHGDYHGRNLLFENDDLRALVDFDEVAREPLVWDIANAVYMIGREARGSFHIRPAVANLILNEYAAHRGLSGEERSAIPMILAMKFPDDSEYYRYCQSIGEDIESRLRREVVMMETLWNSIADLGQGFFE